ncbi:Glycoside hydrolase [Acinetobacter baumannii]
MAAFVFDPETFVSKGHGSDDGDWPVEYRQKISILREFYPEISHWGDLAIGSAFGSFSQDVLEVNWAEWMLESRDEGFLNYCCWVQTIGNWSYGLDGEKLDQDMVWKSKL